MFRIGAYPSITLLIFQLHLPSRFKLLMTPHSLNAAWLLQAEDTVAYHDLDGDMQATKQEILDSLTQWNVVRTRVMTSLELINTGKRKQLEQFERSLDWMRREPAEIPNQVRQVP